MRPNVENKPVVAGLTGLLRADPGSANIWPNAPIFKSVLG